MARGMSTPVWAAALTWLIFGVRKGQRPDATDETVGHSFDGIEEFDNPLPKWWFLDHWQGFGFWMRASTLGGTIALAAGAYFAVCGALRVTEAGDFGALLKRRLGRT